MLPYWVTFFIFAFGSFSRRFQAQRAIGPVLGATLVALTLFVGLRYHVGADWPTYQRMYQKGGERDWSELMLYGDRGFNTLVWALGHVNFGFWSLNLVCAAIFMLGLTSFARRTPNAWLAIATAIPYLIIVVAMSAIRQAAAIGLFYFAINAFRDRRFLKAAGLILVGASFHASAIIMLGILGFSLRRNRIQGFAILLFTLYIGYYVLSSSFDIYNLRYGEHQIQSSGTIYRVIMNMTAAAPFVLLRKRFRVAGDHERGLWTNMSWLAFLCLPALLFIGSSTAIDRFALYLFPLQTYVLTEIPIVLSKRPEGSIKWIIAILVYLTAILFIFLNFAVNAFASIPYRFYPMFGE